jgi:nitrate/nitrite transport system substrate-binding protein
MTSTPVPATLAPLGRRTVLKAAALSTATGAFGIAPALRAAVYAQGSDKPEKEEVKIGFIPLTDCASVVMASVLGLDKKYGVKIIPSKESSRCARQARQW